MNKSIGLNTIRVEGIINMSMREININEMFDLMSKFQGKQIEVDLSPIQASNTYHWFKAELLRDMIVFSDMDNNTPQMLKFYSEDVIEIDYVEGENVFQSVFTINMIDGTQIQICVYEEPVRCFRCGLILNEGRRNTVWEVNSSGGYGSHFDSERVCVKICDDCIYEFIYGEKFVGLEGCLDGSCEGLEVELKVLH